MSQSKFVRVVPVLRTPFGVEAFDYLVPQSLTVSVGQLVQVPFRRQPTAAVVIEQLEESPFAAKAAAVQRTLDGIRFPQAFVDLLTWTAARTFTSKPSVLKAWLRVLPKRIPERPSARTGDASVGRGTLKAHWLEDTERHLLARTRELLALSKRTLIITPWLTRAERLHKALPGSGMLHSGVADGAAFTAWTKFLSGETPCLITTRLGTWIAPMADFVLLDEPENDDHKQDELAPRYDARLMLAWAAKHASLSVESFGLTPPLHVDAAAPLIECPLTVNIRHPGGRSEIPMLQANSLIQLRQHEGPRVIIHPIKGQSARLVCRDCGWRATCASCGFGLSAESDVAVCRRCGKKTAIPTSCASCGGLDLGKSQPGIEKLKAAWLKNEPDLDVEWRDLSNEAMDRPFPERVLVVVTDATLLGGATEDVRRRERQCTAYRRLASRVAVAHGHLIIQSSETAAPDWEAWLTPKGVTAFQDAERSERKLFQYPPAVRLAKLLFDGTELEAKVLGVRLESAFGSGTELRGPLLVPFRARTKKNRYAWHVILPTDTSEAQLIERLTPFAKEAIIDLDPIAFLR